MNWANSIDVTMTLKTIVCCCCGVPFAIPQHLKRSLLETGDWFFCPSGHKQQFAEVEADRLRRQLKERERLLAERNEDLRVERAGHELTRRRHAATKGLLTKTRKRAAAAVCPVDGCKRSFTNMARHLETKHPGYRAEGATGEDGA